MFLQRKVVSQLAVLLAVGVILAMATGHPWLAVVLPSLRAGWRSIATSVWIFGVDSVRRRAMICGLFGVAMGCWQVAATAVVSVAAMVVASQLLGRAPNMERFAAVMTTLLGGVSLTALLGLVASMAALVTRVRVWVHPTLPEILDGTLKWKLQSPARMGWNHAVFVLATSLTVPAVGACGYVLIQPGSIARALSVFALTWLTVIVSYGRLAGRIIADHPSQCWGSSSTG